MKDKHSATTISEIRPLTEQERELVKWLIDHGEPEAQPLAGQLPQLSVVSRCSCGCASVDFAVDGRTPPPRTGMTILSDYFWRTTNGELYGVFLFSKDGLLAGIDLWSIDGKGTAKTLPSLDDLRPIEDVNK